MQIGSRGAMPALALMGVLACSITGSSSAEAAPHHHERSQSESNPATGIRWVQGRLPPGGSIVDGAVVHTVRQGETWQSIAEDYVDLTSTYDPADLAKAIANENLPASKQGAHLGMRLRIPNILSSPPKTTRIGLPKDGVVKGIYVRGSTGGGKNYPALLDRVIAHGMNAIVLDVKDSDGPVTYPSKVPLAVESGAVDKPPIRSYARAVQFAHDRGVRVIARVSCFNDQLMSKAHPGMAIRGVSGHPYRNGWVDPMNEKAQNYVIELVKEVMAAGVDEVQLDYVRFPVLGIKNIDFHLDTKHDPRAKVDVITRFVERVHSVTRARGVPLSLDVFGVIAFGKDADIQNLGQDPSELAKHSEFLSAMVYPSHYDPGFMGLEAPGDHPELVGLGVKHMLSEIDEHNLPPTHAKLRPWLQAMHHRSSNYGPAYIQEEIRTGDRAGAQGFLLWNPGQIYDVAWSALPKKSQPAPAAKAKHR